MGNYRMLDLPRGTLSGGIGIRSPMGPEHPGTVGYLTVPDIDEAIKSAKSAGAKIVMENGIPENGVHGPSTSPPVTWPRDSTDRPLESRAPPIPAW